jgi:CBS domain containing-hemolysin-like protein
VPLAPLLLLAAIAFVLSMMRAAHAVTPEAPPSRGRDEEPVVGGERIYHQATRSAALAANLALCLLLVECFMRLLPGDPILGGILGGVLGVGFQAACVGIIATGIGWRHSTGLRRWLDAPLRRLLSPLFPLVRAGLRLLGRGPETPGGSYRLERDRELRLLPYLRGVDHLVVEDAAEMIDAVREFAEATARDIMTPRTDIEGLPANTPTDKLMRHLVEAEFSRQLVYEGTLDNIVGVLLAKEVLLNRPAEPLTLMRKPLFVPHDMRLPELLRRIRHTPANLAVVLDEYGGTAGIVTMHDLFERVIGEHIEDEFEDDELWVEMEGEDVARLSGRVEVWEVNEELDLDLDESVARTIGGYLMYRFGRLPAVGDIWVANGGEFEVRELDGNRIVEIEFRRRADAREVETHDEDAEVSP